MTRIGALLFAVALVAYAALAYGYLSLTPLWQNPDEPAHYNYVAFVAQTGGLPELKAGDWDSALLERLKNGTMVPGDSVASIQYENWQPPLAYLLAAPVFRLGSSAEASTALFRLRAFDAVLGAFTLVLAFQVAREALPLHLAALAPLAIAGVPMFTAVSAAFSADPLANLLSAAIVLVLVRRLRSANGLEHGRRWPYTSGALLGLGLLAKLALAIFVPLALGVIVVRSRARVREMAITLLAMVAVIAPWLVHQVATYGWTDPLALARHSAVVADQPRFSGLTSEYVGQFLTTSFHSFWAQFGWMGIVAQPRLYLAWGAVTLLAAIGLLIDRGRFVYPEWRLFLATVVLALAAYLGYNLTFDQPQGRYLFPAMAPIAVLFVAGWAAWVPTRLKFGVVLAIELGLVALNGYALLRVLVPGFAPIA